MHVRVFQHVPFEGPGRIAPALVQRGHTIEVVRLDRGETPVVRAGEGLVVMGGPMSVNDEGEFAWLREEKVAIADAIAAGSPVLGICLGAQLIASALGARIYRNAVKEIGWLPVAFAEDNGVFPPGEHTVFHWHGETFDLPRGARLVASSAHCRHQAFFVRDRVAGLQFHVEVGPEEVLAMTTALPHDVAPLGPTVQDVAALRAGAERHDTSVLLGRLLDKLFGKVS